MSKISPQVAFEGSMLSFDQHISAKENFLQSYATRTGAKQSYIDRQMETVNYYYGFKSTVLDLIQSKDDDIHTLKVANVNAILYGKLLEQEIEKLIRSDFNINEKNKS